MVMSCYVMTTVAVAGTSRERSVSADKRVKKKTPKTESDCSVVSSGTASSSTDDDERSSSDSDEGK